MSNFMEDTDDRSFIRMRKCADSCDGCVTDLVVVNASNVDLSTISWFADEHAVRASDKTICTTINECIFGMSDISLTCLAHGDVGDNSVHVIIGQHSRVKLGINVAQGFAGIVIDALLCVAEKDRQMRISEFATQWLCFPRGCL